MYIYINTYVCIYTFIRKYKYVALASATALFFKTLGPWLLARVSATGVPRS